MGIEALAIGSLVSSVAGTAVSMAGTRQTADASRQAAQYKAAVARNNAIIANQNAEATSAAGDVAAENVGMRARANVGSIRAGAAASGLDVNVGTPADMQMQADQIHLLDAMTIRYDAARKATGYRQQGAGFGAEAGLQDMSARNADTAGDIGVASSLLSGASSFSDKWMTYSNRGIL